MKRIRLWRAGKVLQLLGILLVIGAVGFSMAQGLRPAHFASRAAAKTQIGAFKQALLLYKTDTGQFPTQRQGLDALLRKPTAAPVPRNWRGPYLNDVRIIPIDPWGNPYQYQSPGPKDDPYLITSYGNDSRPGGKEFAADILSSDLPAPSSY